MLKDKLIRYSLIGVGIALLLFIIIFNSVWFTTPPKEVDMSFALTFGIPFLASVLCFVVSDFFKTFTKQDAKKQIEKQYRNGVISTEHYTKALYELEMFEMTKKENEVKILLEIEKMKSKINNEKNKVLEKVKDKINEKDI